MIQEVKDIELQEPKYELVSTEKKALQLPSQSKYTEP